jgi:hypothetical protein
MKNKPDYGDPLDYPDIPPANGLSEANYQAVMPENVRKNIADRKAKLAEKSKAA